jgi:hypothetical protein
MGSLASTLSSVVTISAVPGAGVPSIDHSFHAFVSIIASANSTWTSRSSGNCFATARMAVAYAVSTGPSFDGSSGCGPR